MSKTALLPPPPVSGTTFLLSPVFGHLEKLILDRAAPTLVRTLESGQGTGVLKETSTMAVASMAKMFVGDIVEEGMLKLPCIVSCCLYC